MGINIDLNKINYNQFIQNLMEIEKINDKKILEKILLEFGNKIGEEFVILHNEYYEDGICTWNLFETIKIAFKLNDEEYNKVSNIYYNLKKNMIGYKEVDEACENLGLTFNE